VELEVEPSIDSVGEFINDCRTDESNDDIPYRSVSYMVTELRGWQEHALFALHLQEESGQGDL
jgi:hypothetical protein